MRRLDLALGSASHVRRSFLLEETLHQCHRAQRVGIAARGGVSFHDGGFVLESSASADLSVLLLAKLRQRLSAISSSGTLRELQATLEAIRMVEAEAARNRAPTLRRARLPSQD